MNGVFFLALRRQLAQSPGLAMQVTGSNIARYPTDGEGVLSLLSFCEEKYVSGGPSTEGNKSPSQRYAE